MNCLCCGKPLKTDEPSGWHKACVKRFFGTSVIPELEIDNSALEHLAIETAGKGLTIPGVQKKLSLHLMSEGRKPRLTLVNYPTGYILKPQVEDFRALPEAEHLVMSMADAAGISTVPHALVMGGENLAYITRRIDRVFGKDSVEMLAMEDFCQLDLRLTQDKYRGSYERCAKVIERYSSRSGLDLSELFYRLIFCFITGNSDMHLKNFSLIETAERSGKYVLSPGLRPAPRKRHNARGRRADSPRTERKKAEYPPQGLPCFRGGVRNYTSVRRENDEETPFDEAAVSRDVRGVAAAGGYEAEVRGAYRGAVQCARTGQSYNRLK